MIAVTPEGYAPINVIVGFEGAEGDTMDNRSPDREINFLRVRAATLRAMAAEMPPSVARQLLDIAAELEVRAARLEGSDLFEGGEGV